MKLLTPEEIARIRAKLNLNISEAGSVVGGGPRAFAKYEGISKEAVSPSIGLSNLLRILEIAPHFTEFLRTGTLTKDDARLLRKQIWDYVSGDDGAGP